MTQSFPCDQPSADSGVSRPRVLLALSWYYPEMHRGVMRFARDHDWQLTADLDQPVPDDWQGDGILTLLGARRLVCDRVLQHQVPIVDLSESRPEIRLPRVTMDNHRIGRLAAHHFLDRGYQNFAFVQRWNLGVSQRRCYGYRDTLTEAGASTEILCWGQERQGGPDTREERHRWLVSRLSSLPTPLAVFATRDIEAVEVMEAAHAIGLVVPQDVAVLGADNSETICDFQRVPLSSIDNRLEQVGYEGAALLHELMHGASPPLTPVYVAPRGVVERRSTDHLEVGHPGVTAALRFIQEHSHEPICMTDLVNHVCMSRSGLEKAFREHYVRAPMEHLRQVRLRSAQNLLKTTDDKIQTIARRSGFQTAHQLCRVFRTLVGITPNQYRMRHRRYRGHQT